MIWLNLGIVSDAYNHIFKKNLINMKIPFDVQVNSKNLDTFPKEEFIKITFDLEVYINVYIDIHI